MIDKHGNMGPTSRPDVTVCVPVYNASKFIGETLESIRNQTYPGFRVLISVDQSDDQSAAICQAFDLGKPVRVNVKDRHQGLAGNINALLSEVETPYFCIIPHDDIIESDYITTLVSYLKETPKATVTYSDMNFFGQTTGIFAQQPLLGSRLSRVLTFLNEHNRAIPFRGMIRRDRLPRNAILPQNEWQDFACDTAWVLQLACLGEIHRLDTTRVLYRKRAHGKSTVARWFRERQQWHHDAWFAHCLDCARIVLNQQYTEEELKLVVRALVGRLVMATPNMWQASGIAEFSIEDKQVLSEKFLDQIVHLV